MLLLLQEILPDNDAGALAESRSGRSLEERLNRLRPLPRFNATFPPDIKGKTLGTVSAARAVPVLNLLDAAGVSKHRKVQ